MLKTMTFIIVIYLLLIANVYGLSNEIPDTVWTKYTFPNGIHAVKFTKDGKYIISIGDDGIPKMWISETGLLVHEFPVIEEGIHKMDIANNLVAFSNSNGVETIIYDLIDKNQIATLKAGSVFSFTPDGEFLVTAIGKSEGKGNGINIYNTSNWELMNSINLEKNSKIIKVSNDNKYLIRATDWGYDRHGEIEIYTFPDLNYILTLAKKEYMECNDLSFSPDVKYLAGAFYKEPNPIWNTLDWNINR